jgi:iron complex outermembrane recepter protein
MKSRFGMLTCLMLPSAVHAQHVEGMDLEQIMDLKVSSVQRREQRLGRSAAAVYVITAEEIRRSGVTTLADALRLAPGINVVRIDTHTWQVASRGLNGSATNKLLVLIDGRTVYSPIYGGVLWDPQDVLLDDVDRIEVFRGPGATMWGANAVNGVINVITKRATETQGNLLTIGSGRQEQSTNRFRHGGTIGRNAAYRVYSLYQRRAPLNTFSGPRGDPWNSVRGGFRVDWDRSERDSFTLQGDLYTSDGQIYSGRPTAEAPYFGMLKSTYGFSGGNLLGRWRRQFRNGSEMTLQTYFDRDFDDYWIKAMIHTADVDFQYRVPIGKGFDILTGAGTRQVWDKISTVVPDTRFDPTRLNFDIQNGTLQGEWQPVADRVQITFGARVEHGKLGGTAWLPSVRMLWTPNRKQALWGAYSSAVRRPTRLERSLNGPINYSTDLAPFPIITRVESNADFACETVRALEAGYRWELGRRFSVDAAGFWNRYDKLAALIPTGIPAPLHLGDFRTLAVSMQWVNAMAGDTSGLEITADIEVAHNWRLKPMYSGIHNAVAPKAGFSLNAHSLEPAPAHQFQLRSYWQPLRRLQFDSILWTTSELKGSPYPAFLRFDSRVGFSVSELSELSFGVQNLLDSKYPEYRSLDHRPEAVLRRSAWIRLTWHF